MKAAPASSNQQVDRAQLESVKGYIAFVRRSADENAPDVFAGPDLDKPMVSYDVDIRDARQLMNEPSLDRRLHSN